MKRWIPFDPRSLAGIPDIPAVYAIYHDGALAYIGQSCRMRSRFRAYGLTNKRRAYPWKAPMLWPEGGEAVTGKYRTFRRRGEWLACEHRLILRLCPLFNRTFNVGQTYPWSGGQSGFVEACKSGRIG